MSYIQVNEPTMQLKFARVTAVARGYLTRRLLKTQKVQEIIKTIDVSLLILVHIQVSILQVMELAVMRMVITE